MTSLLPRPELLAPAGDRECLRAAVENGADAVYFGLNCGFNARARATNIEPTELPEVMAGLHHRGVKGFVTLNTLAFSGELPELESLVRHIARADVDAVLVQDLGLVRLIRATCPDLPIHASTQMTLTSAECIQVAEELGIERIVLPRELSIREIAKLRQLTRVELEAFVHGALCVAYSGQCLTSESLGGRSANRGQCAQACRLPYDLICDGEDIDLGAQKYLLSPQDLAAYDLTPDLIAAGVCSFKIEGRLKTPEYVANITKHYRAAIDAAVRGEPVEFTRDEVREMELSFSRGFSPGWLMGDDHKMLVPGLSSTKRGVLLGEVTRVRGERIEIRLTGPVARGDGVVFEGDRAANAEHGGRVYGVFQRGHSVDAAATGLVELEFQRGSLDLNQFEPGQKLWKTDDPQLTARLRKSFTGPDPLRKRPLHIRVKAIAGEPLQITATLPPLDPVGTAASVVRGEGPGVRGEPDKDDFVVRGSPDSAHAPTEGLPLFSEQSTSNGDDAAKKEPLTLTLSSQSRGEGTRVHVASSEPLAAARKHPITREFLYEQLSRLGNTVYELTHLDAEVAGEPMVPLSVLSKLRQELVARLDEAARRPRERRLSEGSVLEKLRATVRATFLVPSPPSSGERARVRGPSGDETFLLETPEGRTPHPNPLPSKARGEGTRLHVLCRTLDQLREVSRLALDTQHSTLDSLLYADFQDIREYREAVQIAQEASLPIYIATPRIQKPDEFGLFTALLKHGADGILVRNLSGMRFYAERGVPFVADYTLNATNELTAQFLIEQQSQRVTASYDMNRDQLLTLVSAVPPEWLEIVVYQHMPMFHMEHCVFCAVLSPGTNKHNCGRPCDTHLVQLRDRVGSEHPLKADVGCRNTLFNAVPQSAAEIVPTLIERGVQDFRIEFLDESPTEVRRVLHLYRDLLSNRIRGEEVWRQLSASNRVGITRGTLEERRNPLAIL